MQSSWNLQDETNGDDRRRSNSKASSSGKSREVESRSSARSSSGPELGPIALSFGGSSNSLDSGKHRHRRPHIPMTTQRTMMFGITDVAVRLPQPRLLPAELDAADLTGQGASIHSMTTEEWQQAYEADGFVDLWVQEEFNSGSRLVVRPRQSASPTSRHTRWTPCQ